MVEANNSTANLSMMDSGDDAIDDADVFMAKEADIFTDEFAYDFAVKNPTEVKGTVIYEVEGIDEIGSWTCKRRYNDFHLISELLPKRWPGIMLPKIPPKATSNKG